MEAYKILGLIQKGFYSCLFFAFMSKRDFRYFCYYSFFIRRSYHWGCSLSTRMDWRHYCLSYLCFNYDGFLHFVLQPYLLWSFFQKNYQKGYHLLMNYFEIIFCFLCFHYQMDWLKPYSFRPYSRNFQLQKGFIVLDWPNFHYFQFLTSVWLLIFQKYQSLFRKDRRSLIGCHNFWTNCAMYLSQKDYLWKHLS